MNTSENILVETFSISALSLRIAIVTETFPPEVNGVAMTLGNLVEGVLQRGHAVQLIRPRQPREATSSTRDRLDEVLSKGVALPNYGELRFGLPAKNRLIKLWTDERPDIVHVVTEGPLGWSAVAAARTLQLPITSSFHTNFQSYSQHYGVSLLKAPIESYLRKLHNRTQATMVPTKAMVQDLGERGYHDVKLMSRGVATDLFNPARRSQQLRATWGVSPSDVVVLLVGRLAKEKNIGLVVSAYQAILHKAPTAKLVFVGDGPLRKSLELACPTAYFAGTRQNEELATYYASADLFLFSSLTETFGNVVPEALASGLAVVSYDCAAAGELITNKINGVLVAVADDMAFIHVAVTLAQDSQLLTALRKAAPSSVAHLAWDAVHDRFIDILSGVLVKHGRSFSSAQPLGLPAQERLPEPNV